MRIVHNEIAEGVCLINLSGPFNASQAERVTQTFRNISKQGVNRVVVNLEDVPLIDSRGLASLVAGYRIFGSDAQNFRLAGLQDQPKLVFELTGFDCIFQIFDETAEAVAQEPTIKVQLPQRSSAFEQPFAVLGLAT